MRHALRRVFLTAALLAQGGLAAHWPRAWQAQTDLGTPPDLRSLRVLGLGEDAAVSYAMLLYVQTFDSQAGAALRVRALAPPSLRAWLQTSAALYPASGYAFLLATRIYASASTPAAAAALLDWVEQSFKDDPAQRWPWLAHAVWVARYELHDLPRALRYAQSLRQASAGVAIPDWARQMELFVLAANHRLDAARALLEGLVQAGQIRDSAELKVLLRALESSHQGQNAHPAD